MQAWAGREEPRADGAGSNPGPKPWRARVAELEALLAERDARIAELQTIWDAERAQAQARIAELEKLLAAGAEELQKVQGVVRVLTAKLRTLMHDLYGDKKERTSRGKDGEGGEHGKPRPRRKPGQQSGARGHGRHAQAELDTKYVDHRVEQCANCGLPCEPFPGVETSEEIDWVVKVVRIVHRRYKYRPTCRCHGTATILTAPPPAKLIPKGRYSNGFVANVIVQKYLWAQPLYRIIQGLALVGAEIPIGGVTGVLKTVAKKLRPLYDAICGHNRQSPWLHVDETTWRNLWVAPTKRGWLWIFVGEDTTVYLLDDSRGHNVLLNYLKLRNADPAFTHMITIVCDFMAAYDATLKDKDTQEQVIQLARCWAHYRRLVIEAALAYPHDAALLAWTTRWLRMIDDLFYFRAERAAAESDSSSARAADQALRGCILEMEAVRGAELGQDDLPAKARHLLKLADKHWAELTRCVDDLAIAPDNNAAERAGRTPALCRKNFYGSRAEWARTAATTFWTILFTARQNGLNPLTYLIALFGAIAKEGALGPEVLARFLPWNLDSADRLRLSQPWKEDPG